MNLIFIINKLLRNMIIINARINSEPVFDGVEAAKFTSICNVLNISQPIEVFDTTQLTKVLENNKDKKCLLFSNFPPNSSYPNSSSYKGSFRQTNEWVANSYSNTKAFFEELNTKYSLSAVHFISGAPRDMVTIDLLQSIFSNTLVTLKRNDDFVCSKVGYGLSYTHYFAGKIKDFAIEISNNLGREKV